MANNRTPKPGFTKQQSELRSRLALTIQDAAGKFEALLRLPREITSSRQEPLCSSLQEEPYPPAWLKQPRRDNAFALFGTRGAGKTTLLEALHQQLEKTHGKKLLLLRPVDGSLSPDGVPAGLTILFKLRDAFNQLSSPKGHAAERALRAFEKVERRYMQGAKSYAALARRLAFSRDHFAQIAVESIRDRLGLPQAVFEWLHIETERTGVTGAVVLLDDVDLMPAELPASLICSLLDELHQPRLLLVLAADAGRLELQIAQHLAGLTSEKQPPPAQIETARALLYKVIPGTGRFHILPWALEERLKFSAPEVGSKKAGRSAMRRPLGELLVAIQRHQSLVPLLPMFPRGLENVYRFLKVCQKKDDAAEAKRVLRRRYLEFLADARGEFEVAEELRKPDELRTLAREALKGRDLSPEEWQGLVEDAGNESRPLGALFDSHKDLWVARHADSAWWQEVLVDEALEGGELTSAHLLVACKPLAERLGMAQLSTTLSPDAVAKRGYSQTETQWVVRHIKWPERFDIRQGLFSVRAGWWPFVGGMLRLRDPWPRELFERELVFALPLDEYSVTETKPSACIPLRLRSLVLLADACVRGPYSKARTDWVWDPVDLAMVAAGLGLQTYLFALGERELESPNMDEPSRVWLKRQIENARDHKEGETSSPTMQELARALRVLADHVDPEQPARST